MASRGKLATAAMNDIRLGIENRAVALLGALVALWLFETGCPRRDGEPPGSSTLESSSRQSASPQSSASQSLGAFAKAPSRPTAPVPPRNIHPVGGGPSCIEMYSQCTPNGASCTSVPFMLECGQSGTLPSTGEGLRCVCP